MSKKDSASWLRTLSGISGNLAAGWFGLVLFSSIDNLWGLTRSLVMGIVFTVMS
ncbi:hypothetical protein HY085_01625 [Candidatus Gottesmanbacteria bacterium]|nr:hypothetical protein [Candidatus Gottesmanbacteria bacterium]